MEKLLKKSSTGKSVNLLILALMLVVLPAKLSAREFLNTVVHLNFGGMYSFSNHGDIYDSEEELIDLTFTESNECSHYETAYIVTMDIVPMDPLILGLESNAIKFGIRGTYSLNSIQQRITTTEEFSGELLRYTNWMVGPVIHFAPDIDPSDINNEYTANSGFTFFALYGQIDGNFTAFPSIRDSGATTGVFETGISGSKYNIGIGAEIALCSLNFGVNVYYSYTSFELNKEIYSGRGKTMHTVEGCLEIYVGIPIESLIKPLIPNF